MTEKTILHMDGDAFFVGVETAKDPTLRGLPVVTGAERGIVSALSYEAKALGITRGMPIFRVKKNFPGVTILPGDYASYARYSGLMFDVVRRYADDVEEYSIDECFADITGLHLPLKMTYREIAERIKREIYDELQLSVTIGVAPTKVLAKVASKWVKPNGLTIINITHAPEFLAKTPIGDVWGIGRRTAEILMGQGVRTAGELASKDVLWVRRHFSKPYEAIWEELHGVQVYEVDTRPRTTYSSIQKTRSFHPATNDKPFLFFQLSKHIEDACAKARRYRLSPKKVSIFLKTQNFEYQVRDILLRTPSHAPETLISATAPVFALMHKRGILYRTTGVVLRELISGTAVQGDLFGESDHIEKLESIHRHIDAVETKLGRRLVHLGSTHRALSRERVGTDFDDPERDLLFL